MRSTLVCRGLSISQADGAAHHTTSIRYRSSRLQAAGASIPSALSVGSSPPERPGVVPNSFDPASGHGPEIVMLDVAVKDARATRLQERCIGVAIFFPLGLEQYVIAN